MQDRVSKSQFKAKAKALELFRQIEFTGEAVIVTDHGIPTIEVRQYRKRDSSPLEVLKGSVIESQGLLILSVRENGRHCVDCNGYMYP